MPTSGSARPGPRPGDTWITDSDGRDNFPCHEGTAIYAQARTGLSVSPDPAEDQV